MKGHKVAAHILVPDRLNGFPKALCISELTSASGDFKDQAPHLMAVRIAAPHLAQFSIARRLERWKGLAKHYRHGNTVWIYSI